MVFQDIQGDENSSTSYFLAIGRGSPSVRLKDKVPHIEWNGKTFVRSDPQPLPKLKVRMTPMHLLGRTTKDDSNTKCVDLEVYTDTCAQTCVSGRYVLSKLNMDERDLVPTSHNIMGVSGKYLDILGILTVKFDYRDCSSYAAVYICNDIIGFFVSPKVQVDLGILPTGYPLSSVSAVQSTFPDKGSRKAKCGCLLRQEPPPLPNAIPFPATGENRSRLEQWILDRYAGSAFNACEHQRLPAMAGAPLKRTTTLQKPSIAQSQCPITGRSRLSAISIGMLT